MLLAATRALGRIPVMRKWLKHPLTGLLARLWPDGRQVVRKGGLLYLVDIRSVVDRHIALWGWWEDEQLALMLDRMRRHGCDLFVDVGANLGTYAMEVARAGLAARVVAFKPDPRTLVRLRYHLQINGLPQVEVVEKGVSAARGTAGFKLVDVSNPGMSRIVTEAPDLTVETVPLDEELPMRGARIFVKIDVEGHELEVLAGMRGLIRDNRVFIQVECFPPLRPALDAFAAETGLRAVAHIRDDLFLTNFPD